MANGNGNDAGALALKEALRNFYFYGQLVTARDLNDAQGYLLDKLKTIRHALHGPGIVHGLDVTSVKTDEQGKVTVALKAGVAIDGSGRDVIVPQEVEGVPVEFDRAAAYGSAYLVIYLERDECSTEKVPAYANRAPCEASCCYSRVREGYRLVGGFFKIAEWAAFTALTENYHGKTFSPDLMDAPKAADVFKYGERYIREGKVPGNAAKYGRRLTKDGGVPIWAAPLGIVARGWPLNKEEAIPAETFLARRNVFAADTLFQMIAEHATDKSNPHQTPVARTKVITGKYVVPDFTPATGGADETVTHILGAGRLKRGGEPVTGTVVSVSVGLAYSLKFNEKLPEFSDSCGEFWENEIDSQEKKETLLQARYTSELLFGYNLRFPAWQDQATDGGDPVKAFLAQVSPGTFKEFEAHFTVVPKVEYEDVDGRNVPKLTLKLIENVSPGVVAWSGEVYRDYKDSYIDPAKFPERPPLLDCAFTIYWSAAVSDELDMEGIQFTFAPWRHVPMYPLDVGGVVVSWPRLDAGLLARAFNLPEDFKKFRDTAAGTLKGTDFGKEFLAGLDETIAVAEKARPFVTKIPQTAPEIEAEASALRAASAQVVAAVAFANDAFIAGLDGGPEEAAGVLKAMEIEEGATGAKVAEVKEALLRRAVVVKNILAEKPGG